MNILGIESSCDETAAAVVVDGRHVLSSVVTSQVDVHALFGGVVPEIAAREHLKVIDEIVQQALDTAKLTMDDIDAIAVTQGPGLIGALLVGVAYAKGLALSSGKPLVPVDHVEAHIHGALLGVDTAAQAIYPCLALVVSGGHCNLYVMESPTKLTLVGHSIDDACGECFDKVAKLLGLSYPGGPKIERLAQGGHPEAVPMPKMIAQKSRIEFSYSGLKTYMVNLLHKEQQMSDERKRDICAAFQDAAFDQIVRKLVSALEQYPHMKSVLIAGGVSANQRFREHMQRAIKIPQYFPALKYCSDNAAMIAAYGYHQFKQGAQPAHGRWDAYSRAHRPTAH